jgi:hypothetical protein
MSEDKTEGREEEAGNEASGSSAPRARNRTVMLTPDITDEVRTRIKQDFGGTEEPASFSAAATGGSEDSGFIAPTPNTSSPAHVNTPQAPAPTPPSYPAAPASISGDQVFWTKESKLIGFLVSYDNNEEGEFFELRAGRLIVSSEPAGTGSYFVVSHDSVSPMHAVLKFGQSGPAQVLDQLSENGTRIESGGGAVQELSGEKGEVKHGDILSFGDRNFYVCLIFGESA